MNAVSPELDKIRENVKRMVNEGATQEEVDVYVSSVQSLSQPAMKAKTEEQGAIRQAPEAAKWATPARDVLAELVRPLVETGASIGTATLAPAAAATPASGGTLSPLLAAIGLGALGFAAAKTGLDWVDTQLSTLESSIPREEREAPGGFWPGVKQGLNDYKQGLMYEILGRGVGETVGRVAGALVKKPKTPLEEIAEELDMRFTKAEKSQRQGMQRFETILNKAPFSADIMADYRFQHQLNPLMEQRAELLASEGTTDEQLRTIGLKIYSEVTKHLRKFEQLRGKQLEEVRQNILAELGGRLGYESIGVRGLEALEVANKAVRLRAAEKYLEVGDNFKIGENIETPNLNKVAEEHLIQRLKLPAQESAFIKRLRWSTTSQTDDAEKIMEALEKRSLTMSGEERSALYQKLNELAPPDPSMIKDWQTLVAFDQELGDLIHANDALKARNKIAELDSIGRAYTELQEALHLDMEAAATKAGGDAFNKYQIAKAFYREEVGEVFKTRYIRDIFRANTEDVIDTVFRPNAVTEFRTLKKALADDPEALATLKEGLVQRMFGIGTGEPFNPKTLETNLRKYNETYLLEVFGLTDYAAMRRAAETGQHILLSEPIGESYLKALTRPDTIDLSFIVDNIIGVTERPTTSRHLAPNLTLLRDILDPQTFNELGEVYLERIFTPEAATKIIDPVKLSKTLRENERVLKLWYPTEKYNQLMKIAQTGARMKEASRLAREVSERETLATWTTGGVVLRAVASSSLAGRAVAASIAFGPKALAKLYLSEQGIQILKEASTLPVASAKSAEIATKLLTIVYGTPGPPALGGIEGSKEKLKKERVKRRYQAASMRPSQGPEITP